MDCGCWLFADSNSNPYSNANSESDTNSNSSADSDTYAGTYPNTEPDTRTNSDPFTFRGMYKYSTLECKYILCYCRNGSCVQQRLV